MCGIFGYIGKRQDSSQLILEGLKQLEYRGYDSWGVAVVPKPSSKLPAKIVVKKRVGKIGEATVDDLPPGTLAFGHTRWATHGGVTDTNAHPHLDCSHEVAVVHNGIVENYETIKTMLIKRGHKFVSQTDTEVIAHLIEEYRKSMAFDRAVQRGFNELQGLNAIIVMNADSRQLVAVRNGSPLVVGFGQGENYLASDHTALLPLTKEVHFMEDGQMAIVNEKEVRLCEIRTRKPVALRKQKLSWSVSQAEKGEYPHFMLKEINEQPDVIVDIATRSVADVERIATIIKKSFGTYMVGCGTASYACLGGVYLFSKIAKYHVNAAIGSEFGYHLDFLTPKSLVIALSQSGETMDILESVKRAKQRRATIVAIVNVLGSSLYRLSDHQLLIGAGPEKAVATTKAFTGKIAYLTLLAYALAGKVNQGQKILLQAAKAARQVLSQTTTSRLQTLAKKLKDREHIFVVGRGLAYPTSLEAALKIKEISYIHAEGLPAGELKHGPLALVEPGTSCLTFLPNDETYGATLAAAMEMKARGGYIIGISFTPHEIFDDFIKVEDAKEATIIPNIVVAQLLAYELTLERSLDPDMPRNLAKSVTVK